MSLTPDRNSSNAALATPHQGNTVGGRLDSAWHAVKQGDPERMLQRGNRLRDRGLRHAEMRAGLGHAAVLDDREQDMQVTQPHPPTDPAVPIRETLPSVFTYIPIAKSCFSF